MTDEERNIGKMLADAFDALPESKKERLLGYAEGVADMQEKMRQALEAQAGEKSA